MNWHWDCEDFPATGALQQSAAYACAVGACGGRIARAELRAEGQVLARVQVMRRAGLAVALRGPVWADAVEPGLPRRALRRLARQTAFERRAALVVLPEQGVRGLGIVPLMTPRHVALWDLRPGPEDLRAGMTGKWRTALGAAERHGVRAIAAPLRTLPALIAAEGVQRQARGYRALPGAFTQALPASALRLWQWRQGGRAAAMMCFVRHGDWATYHLGHADAAARAAGAHRVLLWQAALALRAEGVTVLDLGDINTEEAMGLARFKLGSGAALHRLGATCLVLPG
ncbi:GNAT family N-acetyltransferase [Pseudotabrizicola sediminis]|uniref:GNAT family N-acetyltransferase n=1 Tax=Pseudotabrizicola sediminis TaxID=2486418 RepID=A0ABY2KUE4_9RHOB|nr:GNAT family N-acetyltransferase [Pseudotabrizicola sediminis]TGD45162.1 GNAT family N-acetyltransferase [Pseudotabrizicola sediminis]